MFSLICGIQSLKMSDKNIKQVLLKLDASGKGKG
jgi:hypothetical protein